MSTFLEIALRNAARGYRVHPLRGKDAFLLDWPTVATTDEKQIRAWAAKYPNYNCGVAAGPDIAVIDSDRVSRLKELSGEHAAEWFNTYSVTSGRPDRAHFYYRMTDAVRDVGNKKWAEPGINGNVFEVKVHGGQVVAEGSVHPVTGQTYTVTQDLPLIPFPAGLMALIRECYGKDNGRRERVPREKFAEGGRHDALVREAGAIQAVTEMSKPVLTAHLQDFNEQWLEPPLEHDEVERVAMSCNWKPNPPQPEIVFGSQLKENKVTDWRSHYHTREEHDSVEPPCFLIKGFLPVQSIMGIGAFVGQKKTLAALNIAFSLCSSEPLFGKYKVTRKPARVLYLGPENGLISFSDRVNRIGLRDYLGETFFYATMSMPEQTPLGALMPEEVADAAIIIDTAIRFTDGNENDATHMKEFAKQAFSLIRDKAACVIMLHHSPKGMTKAAELTLENGFRGTGELSAFLSVALAMRTQDMENEYESASLFRFVKQRDFEPKPSSFEVQTSRETCRMTFVDGSDGATVTLGNTANKDGKDDAAVTLMKGNQNLSNVKMAKLLKDAGIVRSKEWVRLKRGELGIGGLKVGSTL